MAKHKRTFATALLLLAAMALGAVTGSGCAIQRGERSIVQPLALDKKQFEGEWYYQKTVVDTPYDAAGVFIGSTSNGYKMRWEITRDYLYAFSVQPNVRNADSTAAPIAAWPIRGHFTIRYRISYATGAPSNVIVEDYIDKPWYERPHFRVAWERSVISDFTSFFWIYKLFGTVRGELPVNVRPEQVRIRKSYMDVVSEELLSPGIGNIISKLNTGMPVTSFRVKYRHSWKRVTQTNYTPRVMLDDQFEKFGYFRTLVLNHHQDRGLTDWSYVYYANRHNVATGDEIKEYEAKKIPKEKQKPRQIVYYLSQEFPNDPELRNTAYLIAKGWNAAFQRALNRPGEKIFVLKENDEGLPKGQKRLMGDIRYKFLYWVAKPISFGLLGYGPSFADIDTGEIVTSAAYVYGAVVRRVVNRFLLYYDIVGGRYSDEDLRNGKDYLDIINEMGSTGTKSGGLTAPKKSASPIQMPQYKGFSLQRAHQFVHSPVFHQRKEVLRNVDRAAIQARLSLIDSKPALKWAMMTDEMLQQFFPNTKVDQLRRIQDDDSVKKILDSYLNPANAIRVSGIRKMSNELNIFGKHNMMLEGYVDPAIAKFVIANKNLSRAKLASLMTQMIFRGTEEHEIGHTLGLRHNFAASADEPNYFKEYFELKKKEGGNVPGESKDPRHSWFYMYSSIMDYHGERYGDAVGPGKYDHAAIMYAYGNKLELHREFKVEAQQKRLDDYFGRIEAAIKKSSQFKNIYAKIEFEKNKLKVTKGLGDMQVFDTRQVLFRAIGTTADGKKADIVKMTADDMSGAEALREMATRFKVYPDRARRYVDGRIYIKALREEETIPLRRHYYRFCSDELVGQDPFCNRFDSGVNPEQIIGNMVRRYDGNYPIRNWSRGRRYYRLSGGYLYGLMSQFRVVSDFYQNWIWRVINETGYDGSPQYFEQLAAIQKGVAFISRVIHTPEPGRHVWDSTTGAYVSSNKPSNDSLNVDLGRGRYFYSKLQEDELGLAMYRFDRIGTMYDKYVAMMTLAIRDWGLAANRLDFFFVNFSDFFSSDDVIDIFTGAISGSFNKKFAFAKKVPNGNSSKTIAPNWHPVLQYMSMYMAMAMLNSSFFGNTFSHYMTVARVGSGDAWQPPKGAKTIKFVNQAGTHSFIAVQTQDGRSIAYKLVERGNKLAAEVRRLRSGPVNAVNSGLLEEKENQLRWVETVLGMMNAYVQVFFDN